MNKQYQLPIILSLAIHGVIAAVLLVGDFTTTPKPKPTPTVVLNQPINAVAVSKAVVERHAEKLRKQKAAAKAAEEKRLRDLERRAEEARKKRAKEEQRLKNIEKQRKKKEREKKIADEKARQATKAAAAAKAKRLKEEAAAKKARELRKKKEAERKRKEAERKKKAEAERKRKEAERKRKQKEAQERAEQEKLLAQQMEQEMASRQQARQQQMVGEISRYTALITQTIQRYLITDQATMEGKSCKLTINLAPSGFVTNVKTGQGSPVVCSAAKNAVLKAGTLPVSKDPEVFKEMRVISLTVVPEF